MPITFNQIPSTIRDPGVYAERDNSRALRGLPTFQTKVYFLGQKLSTGSATANTPKLVNSVEEAKAFFGRGSQLAQMIERFKQGTRYIETWAIPLDDAGAGTAASGSLAFGGPATANGTIHLYIGGKEVRIGVAATDTDAEIATAVTAAINADGDLPVTAAVNGSDDAQVDITARHKGTLGNGIDLQLNYYGEENGQALPAGVTCTVTAMASGATDPDYQDAIDAIPAEVIDHFVLGTNVTAEIVKVEAELADRYDFDRNLYGFAWYAKNDTVANLGTFGNARNSEFGSCYGIYKTPTPYWEVAAAYCGAGVVSLLNDPARPTQTLVLEGVLPPPRGFEFTQQERDTLLYDGISPAKIVNGQVTIARAITTYQTNSVGAVDPSYLDSESIFTLNYIQKVTLNRLALKFGRHKLVADGTAFGAGQAIVTPNIVKAELIAIFSGLQSIGLVEDIKQFINELIVEINGSDPNRLDILMPPNLANQLRITALKLQFLL